MKLFYKLLIADNSQQLEALPQSILEHKFEESNESVDEKELKCGCLKYSLQPNQNKQVNISECFEINNLKLILVKSDLIVNCNINRGSNLLFQSSGNLMFVSKEIVTGYVYDPANLVTLNISSTGSAKVYIYLAGS